MANQGNKFQEFTEILLENVNKNQANSIVSQMTNSNGNLPNYEGLTPDGNPYLKDYETGNEYQLDLKNDPELRCFVDTDIKLTYDGKGMVISLIPPEIKIVNKDIYNLGIDEETKPKFNVDGVNVGCTYTKFNESGEAIKISGGAKVFNAEADISFDSKPNDIIVAKLFDGDVSISKITPITPEINGDKLDIVQTTNYVGIGIGAGVKFENTYENTEINLGVVGAGWNHDQNELMLKEGTLSFKGSPNSLEVGALGVNLGGAKVDYTNQLSENPKEIQRVINNRILELDKYNPEHPEYSKNYQDLLNNIPADEKYKNVIADQLMESKNIEKERLIEMQNRIENGEDINNLLNINSGEDSFEYLTDENGNASLYGINLNDNLSIEQLLGQAKYHEYDVFAKEKYFTEAFHRLIEEGYSPEDAVNYLNDVYENVDLNSDTYNIPAESSAYIPSLEEQYEKYTIEQLLEAGYPISDFREQGFSAEVMKRAGIPANELFEGGYTLEEMHDTINAGEMRQAGFEDPMQLQNDGGYTLEEMHDTFNAGEMRQAGFEDPMQLHNDGGYTLEEMHDTFNAGEMRQAGFEDPMQLHNDGGYTLEEMHDTFNAGEMRQAGFEDPMQLHNDGGYTLEEMHDTFNAGEMRQAGFEDPMQLHNEGGYTLEEMHDTFNAGEMRQAGFEDPMQLHNEGGYTLEEMHDTFNAGEMRQAGFEDPMQLHNEGGYTLEEMHDTFNAGEMRQAGFEDPMQLHNDGGYTLEEMHDTFNAGEMRQAGFEDPMQLHNEGGYTLEEMHDTFNAGEMRQAGFEDPMQLHNEGGYTLEEMHDTFNAGEMKQAGFEDPMQLHNEGGYTLEEMHDTFNAGEMRQAGFEDPMQLHNDGGYTLEEMHDTFNAVEMRQAGFEDPMQLHNEGGYTLEEMHDTFNAKKMKDAGFTNPMQLHDEGNYNISELHDSFSIDEMLNAGFDGYELKQYYSIYEFSAVMDIEEMKNYFTLEELVAAGLIEDDDETDSIDNP